ncbi:MAG: membrane protein insertion efficiency factor YidD [Acidimicrobiia bacterium]|nr:membrane protein insertion efficiency factor YidD [Acidimicrobiia bacterium]
MTTHDVTSPAPYQLSYWLMAAIRLYQRTLSPLLGQSCRFSPTCSMYAYDSIRLHGALRGSWLAVKRVGRCNPWGGLGLDPVPQPDREVGSDLGGRP